MNNFTLQIVITVLVWVNNLDCTIFRYWFEIPEDIANCISIIQEKLKLPIAEIKAELWEDAFCAMSDRYEPTDDEIFKIVGKSADKIDSATVEIHIESMAHVGKFRKELLAENSNFRGWSPTLHNVIENEIDDLRHDILDMLIAIAKAHYDDSDGGGDPRYELRRNNKSNRTDT